MSLHALATDMASKGRNGDSMLVHMTPGEVAGLHALAVKHGGELTINPDTGLPEANFLKSLLPIIAGFALGPAGFGLVSSSLAAGAVVGGITGLATGSLSKGLMAGLGAYGGFGIGEALVGAGANTVGNVAGALGVEGAATGVGSQAAMLAAQNAGFGAEGLSSLANSAGVATGAAPVVPSTSSLLSSGLKAATATPEAFGAFAKQNIMPLAAAASPIVADMMVPTTTKAPTPTDTGYIRQKIWDGRQFVDVGPVKASDWGSRNFSDIYRGYDGGGIVALARGGVPRYDGDSGSLVQDGGTTAPAINSVEDLYTQVLGRAPDAGGLAYWQQGFGDTIDANEIASFKQAAQAELANRTPAEQLQLAPNLMAANNATTGGVTNLVTTGNIAADTSGINALNNTGAVTGGTSLADAQGMVNNMYRNVLGRDADPEGLKFWSSAIASGRSADSIYQDFLASARSNTELVTADQIKNKTFAEATTPYKGYMSSDVTNIVDDWVRNTLGREPTAVDKQQQWYKDAFTSMSTQGQAKGLYGQFQGYAGTEATKTIADRIKAIDAELKAKNLTDADLLAQTGKTKQQLASEGIDLSKNLIGASQLTPAGSRTAYDLKAKLAALTPITNTNDGSAVARTVTNPYGNKTNPGDLTRNVDGSTTVTPNIPGRPYGGFPGMASVRDAYTQGGGSLGYTSPTFNTIEDFNAQYLDRMGGDSRAAYDYLTGKGGAKYPTKSGVGQISKPYDEEVMGYPAKTNVPYTYDKTSGKMVRNFDYVAPSRDAKGNVNYSMSLNEMKKYLTTNPLSGQALYDWAQSNGVSAQDVADATGRKLSDVYTDFRAAAKKAATAKTTATENGSETPAANGGLMGYAVGGGLGSLGSYSDGGRLLKGPGDGVSDSIPATIGQKQQPARLADGEFVVPARIVSELGNGSTDAGAKKLYAMLDRVQRARGKTTGKNKVAANSRADKYLPA